MSSTTPGRSRFNPRILGWILGMAAAFAVMYYSLPKKDSGGLGGPTNVNNGDDAANTSQCEKKLTKWITSVDPVRLQFNTDIESRILELNRYWSTCGSKDETPIVSDLKPIEALIQGEYLDRATSRNYGRRDIEHLRQALLLSRIATRISQSQKEDHDRVWSAMNLVSQQMEPLPSQGAAERPLTPFECLVLGQGTPEDRAWVFVELLRQLHLDAVVFTTDDAAITPLVGVVIEQNVYLYEPMTGFPVPAPGESERQVLFHEPTTLPAALADDSIFRQLDIEGTPCPWTADRLKSARVGLVGTSSTWAPRLAELQFQWPIAEPCVIYDGLGPSAGTKRGLTERVSAVLGPFGFTADRISVWDYPERQCVAYDALGAELAPHVAPLVAVMSGPTLFEVSTDTETGTVTVLLQRSKRALQQVRVKHLLGNHKEAIEGYLPMIGAHLTVPKDGAPIDGLTQAAMDQNRIVADKATYWMAAVQFESGKYEASVDMLKRYAKNFPLGVMGEAAAMRMAACLAKAHQNELAAKILIEMGPGPNQIRRALLARRLLELKGPAGEAPKEPAPNSVPENLEIPATPEKPAQ